MSPTVLTGGLGFLAVLYRAFRGVLTPAQVDESELWQLAVLLDADIDSGAAGLAAQHERYAKIREADRERVRQERAAAQARLGGE